MVCYMHVHVAPSAWMVADARSGGGSFELQFHFFVNWPLLTLPIYFQSHFGPSRAV